MRINIVMGFFLPVPPAAGGATEKSWHRLAQEFTSRGHDVTIVSRRWEKWPDEEKRHGVRFLRFKGHNHTSSLFFNLCLDALWSLKVWRRLPGADVTVVNAISLPIFLGWNRRNTGKLVVMVGRMPKGQFRIYRNIDRVLAVSTPVLDAVRRENPAAAGRALVTGYPIDCSLLAAGIRETPAVLTIGFIGRIHREKGLDLLANAAEVLAGRTGIPPWRLLLCGPTDTARGGSGPRYAVELRGRLNRVSVPAGFEMLPAVFDSSRLSAVHRGIDIFCYPSLATRGETFGVSVAEAMAAGAVPVVSK
ncbi:MAG: glycosyltransferase family 4 protein, partial [Opitutus sp.]